MMNRAAAVPIKASLTPKDPVQVRVAHPFADSALTVDLGVSDPATSGTY